MIREKKAADDVSYSERLHRSLIARDSVNFWKAFNNRFGASCGSITVDGTCDNAEIVLKFAEYFRGITDPPTNNQETVLARDCAAALSELDRHPDYVPYVDVALVSSFVAALKKGKSSGPDDISSEHLIHAHSYVCLILCKLFNWIITSSIVPDLFTVSYIVPIPKGSSVLNKICSTNDFRGIAISSVISKVFEKCIMSLYADCFSTADNQLGFKKGTGCNNAIFCLRETVDDYIRGGDTANVAALDITKAFPRVNHDALLLKLSQRNTPPSLLLLIKNWLSANTARVKWCGLLSGTFALRTGVNQGAVLAPFLFALLINDVIVKCNQTNLGLILIYADDILLVSRGCYNLQRLFDIVQDELLFINLELNASKCVNLRIGPRADKPCAPLMTRDGAVVKTVDNLKYLGVVLTSSVRFNCSPQHLRHSFNRACNSVLAKLLGRASEELILHIIRVKCLPILLYGCEVSRYTRSVLSSIDFTVVRFGMRIFRSSNRLNVIGWMDQMGFHLPSELIPLRIERFNRRLRGCENAICLSFLC
jgi:hypothetical protein